MRNELKVACCLLVVSSGAPISSHAQALNSSVGKALTPGYGISDYFQLMPGEVNNHAGVRPRMGPVIRGPEVKRLRLTPQRVEIAFMPTPRHSRGKLVVSILTPSGRAVERIACVALYEGSVVFPLRKALPECVYVVRIEGAGFVIDNMALLSR